MPSPVFCVGISARRVCRGSPSSPGEAGGWRGQRQMWEALQNHFFPRPQNSGRPTDPAGAEDPVPSSSLHVGSSGFARYALINKCDECFVYFAQTNITETGLATGNISIFGTLRNNLLVVLGIVSIHHSYRVQCANGYAKALGFIVCLMIMARTLLLSHTYLVTSRL